MEQAVTIPCGDIDLEGRLKRRHEAPGVVVMHPHPLYGGDMDNPVVIAITRAYARAGYSTLRFNFRGVGASGGAFEEGRGERLDLLACIDYLGTIGIHATDLSGYSFGAWVLSGLSPAPGDLQRVVMVAPPVALMDFSDANPALPTVHALTGSRDEIAPPGGAETLLKTFRSARKVTVLEGADHFYTGCINSLEEALFEILYSSGKINGAETSGSISHSKE